MLNAAALVSGDGAELQSLLDSVFFGEIEGFSLAAVISTERGSFALTRAEGAHVPGYVVEEAIFPNGASFSLALLNKLHDLDIDFIILAGFAPKLSEGLARAYRGRAVGVRCALSPAFDTLRAPDLCRAAIDRGVRWTAPPSTPRTRAARWARYCSRPPWRCSKATRPTPCAAA